MEQLKHIFKDWDRDGSGEISCDELKQALKILNPEFSRDDLDMLFRMADRNHDGVVSYDEFVEFIWGEELHKNILDALFISNEQEVCWTYRVPAPRRVAQIVAGPYSVFALLDDGSCWQFGPKAVNSANYMEPKRLDNLCEACGTINYLGIDYQTVVAVGSNEGRDVWMHRPEAESLTHADGAIELLCTGGDSSGWTLRCADRLSGRGIVDVHGDLNWGVVMTASGSAFLYASGSARKNLGGFLKVGTEPQLWGSDSALEPQTIFAEFMAVPAGEQLLEDPGKIESRKAIGIRRIVMLNRDEGALLLMRNNTIASLSRYHPGTVLGNDQTVAVHTVGLGATSSIVDISSNGIALDGDGKLWRIHGDATQHPIAIVGNDVKITRFGGAAAVAPAGGKKGELAFAVGDFAASAWALGLRSFGQVQLGEGFAAGYLGGVVPGGSLRAAADLADFWFAGGANQLAYRNGRDLVPEQGVDLKRLTTLLETQCDPNAEDKEKRASLLTCFARRAAAGEPGMSAAAKKLVEHGADLDAAWQELRNLSEAEPRVEQELRELSVARKS